MNREFASRHPLVEASDAIFDRFCSALRPQFQGCIAVRAGVFVA